jgi:mono/diheme cytochrome c family protein
VKPLAGLFLTLAAVLPGLASPAPNPKNGPALFKRVGCIGCHRLYGGPGGPDLTQVGQRMDFAAIKKQIEHPKATNPKSLMPGAHDLGLKQSQVDDLAAYLASLK